MKLTHITAGPRAGAGGGLSVHGNRRCDTLEAVDRATIVTRGSTHHLKRHFAALRSRKSLFARPNQPPWDRALGTTFDLDAAMADPLQPTQPATQLVDPRKVAKHLSDISNSDASDIICLLHGQTTSAQNAIHTTMLYGPQHILQNDDLGDLEEDDLLLPQFQETRELALRISSKVKAPRDGFIFGRNKDQCDVLLTSDPMEKLVSNRHFKIYINNHGSLMLQDLSTNGTIVDGEMLRARAREVTRRLPTRAISNGSIVSVIGGPNKTEIKFLVRVPSRQDQHELYDQKIRKYLEARGLVPHFASMRESQYGNYWDGGDEYNFTGNIGKGAFATVYRVQRKISGLTYAAKEIDKRRFIKNGLLDVKFDNELKIMQQLKHPNIVEYVDCKHYEHWIYIIMELVSYGELSSELRSRGRLPEPEVQQITRQMMHALLYLHNRGITHRDIKPDNILIASRAPLIVKLTDFGLSKCVSDNETFLKTFCGTLLYCAPEVYPDYGHYSSGQPPKRRRSGDASSRPSPYDDSVDMWSFGAVIFHLLAGKAPITGRGDDKGAQMLSNIMTKSIDFSPLEEQFVSGECLDFIMRLLERVPHNRLTESQCLKHPWIRDVPDVVEYLDEGPSPDIFRRALEAVQEINEDHLDVEMIQELEQLTQGQQKIDVDSSLSPKRPLKKPRWSLEPEDTTEKVVYPELPDPDASWRPDPEPKAQAGRLFGEITPAAQKSSGIFGMEPPSAPSTGIPELRRGVEQISVNDARSLEDHAGPATEEMFVQPAVTRLAHERSRGSATSLLGAEAQIGQLNVASPAAEGSDVDTPETNNPVTPKTRDLSPSNSISKPAEIDQPLIQPNELGKFNRTVDLNLVNNAAAYAAEVAAREASRAEIKRKAETFQAAGETRQGPSVDVARTIDVVTGQPRRDLLTEKHENLQHRMISTVQPEKNGFARPPRRYGKLISTPESYANITIPLEVCDTFWGRHPTCNVQYPDVKDTRIPKWALKVWFWAEGLDQHVKNGGEWTEYPNIYTIIATSARNGISVNGIRLAQTSEDGQAALYGKLYRGDVITVYEQNGDANVLKFNVEILFGQGARTRPEAEKPFKILREEKRFKQYREQLSLRQSMIGDGAGDAAPGHGPMVPVLREEAEIQA
jgi:serine/threonine protein kinase